MDWETIELLGYAYYAKRGYRILISLIKFSGYDFVIEKEGNFARVNVKTCGLKDRRDPNSWCIMQAGYTYAHPEKNYPADLYLAWLPDKGDFIELPGTFFDKTKSKSRRIPKSLIR